MLYQSVIEQRQIHGGLNPFLTEPGSYHLISFTDSVQLKFSLPAKEVLITRQKHLFVPLFTALSLETAILQPYIVSACKIIIVQK